MDLFNLALTSAEWLMVVGVVAFTLWSTAR